MRAEIEEYLQQGKAEGWSARTIHSYQKRLTMLANFLGDVRRVDVKPQDLERFIQHLRRSGCKRASRRAFASTTRNFFAWLSPPSSLLPRSPCYGTGCPFAIRTRNTFDDPRILLFDRFRFNPGKISLSKRRRRIILSVGCYPKG